MKKQFIILLVFLSACASTQPISYVTGISDASVPLPEGAKDVILLNRVRLAYPYYRSTTVLNPNNPTLLNAAFNAVRSSIQNQGYLRVLRQTSANMQRANNAFPAPLSVLDLQQVATGSDMVIALEKFDQRIEDSYTIDIRRESLGNSTYREVDFYIGKRSIQVSIGWKLYATQTGEVIDTWEEEETYFYESEARTRARATELLKVNYQRELQNKGSKLGHTYATRISPTVHRRTLPLYSYGNEALQKGIRAVREENWEEANTLWTDGLAYEEKRRKKAMLLHNLAISHERQGKTDEAKRFAARAAAQHPLGKRTQRLVGFAPAAL